MSAMSSKMGQQRARLKKCQFPGCEESFMGRGKTKYCAEHQKSVYRKILYKKNDNFGGGIINIPHSEFEIRTISRVCGLDGCDEMYDITLIPGVDEYPNYCVEHRNEYKRKRFLEQ